jgi:hypothetical protein
MLIRRVYEHISIMIIFTSLLDSDILQAALPSPKGLPSILPPLLLQFPKPILHRNLFVTNSDDTVLDSFPVLHQSFDIAMIRAAEAQPWFPYLSSRLLQTLGMAISA